MKTRMTWLILVVLFCGILSANAQPGKYSAGLKAGFGIPNLSAGSKTTPLSENYTSRYGFYGGFIGEMQVSKIFSLRGEINYSSQGGKRNGMQALPLTPELQLLWDNLPEGIPHDNYMYADIKSEAIINYLEIPVLAKFTFEISSRIHFYMQGGPYMGILLNAKNVTKGSSSIFVDKAGTIPVDGILQQAGYPTIGSQSFDHTENITSDIHRFNVGGQGIAGFSYSTDSGRFFIEGGGNYGFIPIQKDNANGSNNTGAGTVTVGYLINL